MLHASLATNSVRLADERGASRVFRCRFAFHSGHIFIETVVCVLLTYGWRRGVVVGGVRRMNEVNARRARLVIGWVAIFGRV